MLDSTIRVRHPVEIVICAVVEHETAWAFAYNTRPFLENADFLAGLVGNGPVVVPKNGDSPFLASSARPILEQLDQLDQLASEA